MNPRTLLSVGLAALALLTGFALVRRRLAVGKSSSRSSEGSSLDSSRGSWTENSGVELSQDTAQWLQLLADAGRAIGLAPFHVTSGRRSARKQAAAMLAKVKAGEDLRALYADDDAIETLLGLEQNEDAWAGQIQAWIDVGRYLSSHLRADAVDLRTNGLDDDTIAAWIELAEQLGAEPILERDHLHIEGFLEGGALVS